MRPSHSSTEPMWHATPLELMVNSESVLFTFSRISPLNTLPLITRLVTSPVSGDIHGTEVICQDRIICDSSSTIILSLFCESWKPYRSKAPLVVYLT